MIRRYLAGAPVVLPFEVLLHMVAARYGQTPAQVREWPADDFTEATYFLPVTRGQ